MRYDQSFCEAIGKWGCYALCIINIAEEVLGYKLDKLKAIEEAIERGYISWNEDNYADPKNFDIDQPALMLGMLTGRKFTVRKEFNDILYKPQKDEYIVERWERNGYGHFARTKAGYNSLQDSKCVTLGKLASLRVFKQL